MKRLSVALSLFFAMLISAPAFAESKGTAQNLEMNDCRVLVLFAQLWNKSSLIERENAAWIVKNSASEYGSVNWLHTPQRRKQEWDGPLPHNTFALAHTHPDKLDPKPSEQDKLIARKIKIPLYTLSRKGIWRAAPDGAISQEAGPGWFKQATDTCDASLRVAKSSQPQ